MISKDTKAAINKATTVSPAEKSSKPESDTKIVFAPLLTHAAIALGIVAVIVTTAVMTEDHIDEYNFETQIVAAESESLDDLKQTSLNKAPTVVAEASPSVEDQPIVNNDTDEVAKAPISVTKASLEEPQDNVETQVVVAQVPNAALLPQSINTAQINSVQHAPSTSLTPFDIRLAKQDQRQLAILKSNHERQVSFLRNQAEHNSYVEKNIEQLESNYLKQVAIVKRNQDTREASSNRI